MRRSKKRLKSRKYTLGYLEVLGGIYYIRIADKRKSTKLLANSGNKSLALEMLEAAVGNYLQNGTFEVVQLVSHKKKEEVNYSVLAAYSYFINLKRKDMSLASFLQYTSSIKYFFDTDCPLDYDSIFYRLHEKSSNSNLADSTRKTYIGKITQFFNELIKLRLIKENPALTLDKPKITAQLVDVFLPEEVSKIIDAAKQRKDKFLPYFYQLAYYTGMRPVEIYRLRKSDIDFTSGSMRINGKGDRIRYFPINKFPHLENLLKELFLKSGEHLFSSLDLKNCGNVFNSILKVAGVEKRNRKLYTLRSSAEYYFEKILLIDFKVCCDLLGHSTTISEKHYRTQPKAPEIANRINVEIIPPF